MPDQEGLCRVQRACEAAIEEALQGTGASSRDRSIGSAIDGARYVRAVIRPHDIGVWIYRDTVSFLGIEVDRRIEEWDCRLPQEFVQQTAVVASQFQSSQSGGDRGGRR
jgi:hypothetical protein